MSAGEAVIRKRVAAAEQLGKRYVDYAYVEHLRDLLAELDAARALAGLPLPDLLTTREQMLGAIMLSAYERKGFEVAGVRYEPVSPPRADRTVSPTEAHWAADWHDYIVDMGGKVPDEETEFALRLRGVQ